MILSIGFSHVIIIMILKITFFPENRYWLLTSSYHIVTENIILSHLGKSRECLWIIRRFLIISMTTIRKLCRLGCGFSFKRQNSRAIVAPSWTGWWCIVKSLFHDIYVRNIKNSTTAIRDWRHIKPLYTRQVPVVKPQPLTVSSLCCLYFKRSNLQIIAPIVLIISNHFNYKYIRCHMLEILGMWAHDSAQSTDYKVVSGPTLG